MSGISGISGSNSYNDIYGNIASGNRIQRAADDAAGMEIASRQETQLRTSQQQQRNSMSRQDALNVADGGRSGISGYLQDINSLAVQSLNGLYSDSDRRAIQNQINAYAMGINDAVSQARYNETSVLNGTSARSLGVENFNVMDGNANLDTISSALNSSSAARAAEGAQYNGLASDISNLGVTAENTAASISRISDEDIAEASTNLKREQTLDQYQNQMQRKEMEDEADLMNKMLGA